MRFKIYFLKKGLQEKRQSRSWENNLIHNSLQKLFIQIILKQIFSFSLDFNFSSVFRLSGISTLEG